MKEKLHPDYNYTLAEVVWAIRQEMTTTVEDVLARHVWLLLLDPRVAIYCTDKITRLLAKELGHNES